MSAPTFEDWWAITRTIALYAEYADARRFEEMAALFAADGAMHMYRPRATEAAESPAGRAALTEAFGALTMFVTTSHVLAPSRIRVDGDVAHAVTRCTAHHISETEQGKVRFSMADRYEDDLVRVGDGWLFLERRKYTDWTETTPLRR